MNSLDIISIDALYNSGSFTSLDPKAPLVYGSIGFDAKQSYIIKGVIPENSFVSIYGPSGSFKSFLALDWACHIASGMNWDGHKVKKGSVLYVAGEGGIGVSQRVRAWEIHHSGKELSNLARLSAPVFPADGDQVKNILTYCEEIESTTGYPVKLIILDTLARCYGGNDENSSRDMGAFIQGCDQIKLLTGASVLIVHHTGKNIANGARGSSALPAALDVEFQVQREEDSLLSLVLTCSKMKDAVQPSTKAYDLSSVFIHNDEDGEEVTSLHVNPCGRAPGDTYQVKQTKNMSDNHLAVILAVKKREASGEQVTRKKVIADLKADGLSTTNFAKWADKLSKDDLLIIEGERLSTPNSSPIAPKIQ